MGAEKPDYSLHIKAQRESESQAVNEVRKGLFAQMVGKFINPLRPILEFLNNPIKFILDFPMRRRFKAEDESQSLPQSAPPMTRGTPSPGARPREMLQQIAQPEAT
ncbi:MAG TPA: hypothetical protein PKU95_02450 [Candidatus Dojkabacteria bacterium]|jgi:hypothetical protein|nr:hypothetical protein [Candidatus Dojkabacteria bacterium]